MDKSRESRCEIASQGPPSHQIQSEASVAINSTSGRKPLYESKKSSELCGVPKENSANGLGSNLPSTSIDNPSESNEFYTATKKDFPDVVSLDSNLPPASLDPVMAPLAYISSLPSKGVRDKLICALNLWLEVTPEALPLIESLIADVHNLSLILDDVQDNSPMRRGKPATHSVFGMPQAVNSATFQIVNVISRTLSFGDPVSLSTVIDGMKCLLIGQGHDLLWTNLVSAPTVDEYLRMVDGKTGGLFRMISRLMIAQSKSDFKSDQLDRLMILFGRFFQIRDDYANLTSDQYTKTKGFCEDLDEGKYSFILVHAIQHGGSKFGPLLQNMLIQRRATGSAPPGHKELILSTLTQIGSLEYTARSLLLLQNDLEDEVRQVERSVGKTNPILWQILAMLRV